MLVCLLLLRRLSRMRVALTTHAIPRVARRHQVTLNVHYFEDGNVQLDDKVVFQCELPATADQVGGAFVKKVRDSEQGLVAKLEEVYTNMSDNVLQGLRRRLPITKTKFDWDKAAVAKLAQDLQTAAGMNIS